MNQKANVMVPQLGTNLPLSKTVQQSVGSALPRRWRFSRRFLTALDAAVEDGRKLTTNFLAVVGIGINDTKFIGHSNYKKTS
jgi:hypothetical protein